MAQTRGPFLMLANVGTQGWPPKSGVLKFAGSRFLEPCVEVPKIGESERRADKLEKR